MKYLDFYNKLNSMDDKEYVETFLVYNLSLLIAGAKPAVTITLKKNNYKLYNNWNLFGSPFVNTLKSRYEQYHCPHEIGIFLGIPIKDVKDFIECTTKKCLLCKYWKVYNDSAKAEIIFNTYDKIKEYTMETILKGNSSINLALSIKNSFEQNA